MVVLKAFHVRYLHCLFLCVLTIFPASASAESYASAERAAIALGHYGRARALLVEALAEFERGRHVARPDMLLDAEEWRISIISRTEELNRVLDPQPRVTRSGVQYQANKALIRRDSEERLPVPPGAQDSNIYGEKQRSLELERARLSETAGQNINTQTHTPSNHLPITNLGRVMTQQPSAAITPSPGVVPQRPVRRTERDTVDNRKQHNTASVPKAVSHKRASTPPVEDDEEISKAIEDAISAHMQKFQKLDPNNKNNAP